MSFAPDPFVALIDTNAMVPVRARDVLFTFDQYNLFRARLTSDIMDEWERTLVERLDHATDNVAEQRKVIEETFEANFVPGYRPLIGPGRSHRASSAISPSYGSSPRVSKIPLFSGA